MVKDNKLMLSGHKLIHHLDELSKWKNNQDFPPIYIEIGPTSACNHRCKHCYISYLGHKPVTLDKDVLLNLVKDLGSFGVKSICFAGRGEPLLHKGLPEAIEIAKKSKLDIALATNGIFLDAERAKRILEHITWVRFSILGGSPETYSKLQAAPKEDWGKLLVNVRKSVELKKENNLNTTLGVVMFIFEENGHEVFDTAKLFKDIGVDYFVVKPVGDYAKNDYIAEKKLKQKFKDLLIACDDLSNRQFKCNVRWDMFEEWGGKEYEECLSLGFMPVIDSDGCIYPCGGYWRDERYSYGSLYESSFREIWQSKKRRRIMDHMQKKVDFSECYNCCRNHTINNFLWSLKNAPDHVNFI